MSQQDNTSSEAEHMPAIELSTVIDSIQENEENITFIWFDPFRNITDDTEKIKEDLRAVNNVALFPVDIDSCMADIKSRETEKIFLITASNIASKLLPNMNDLSQLDSIFIFSQNRNEFDYLCDDYRKVVGIFGDSNDLIISVKENIKHINTQIEEVSFYDQHQQGTRDLSEQSAEFLWYQLFIDVIQRLPPDNKAKEEMLTVCRHHCRNDPRFLKDIDEFDRTYCIDNCILWYTKETFVYQLINKALRTEDIEQLYTFRFYIADLSKQLAEKCTNIKTGKDEILYFYRGTKINKKEVEKFKVNVGKLIATNGYWSTSRDQSYALTYANKLARGANDVAVLFEIKCDLKDQNDSIIFADIAGSSQFEAENEVLFDAGSIFQIEKMRKETKDDVELYVVELRATEEGREITKKYIEENRREMEYESPKIMLGILLKRLGKYEKSFEYFKHLLKNPSEEKMSHIHNRIGIALKIEKKYDQALEQFDKAYDLISKSYPLERIYLALIRHNQGQVYVKKTNCRKALMYYQEAVDIVTREKSDINPYIAEFYSSIGRLYSNRKEYETAMVNQQKALEIRELCFSSDNVILAFSYADIGNIFLSQNNYMKALEYHFKALELRQKYLLPDHHNTAWSLHRVGKVYYANGNSKEALEYYLKSLAMTRKCPSPSQHDILLSILDDIAFLHGWNSQEALDYRLQILDIRKNAKSINYSRLPRLLDDIGFTCKSIGRMEDSLKYYKEALQIREKKLSKDDFSLSHSFNSLASLYEVMGDMAFALEYYRKALKIYEHHLSRHHWHCKKARNNIERIRRQLR